MQGLAQAGGGDSANSLVAVGAGQDSENAGDQDRRMILKYAQNYLDYTAIDLNEK